jgi:osmotically inducible protein OsmC
MNTLYQAQVSAEGGRNGKVKSSDGVLEFEVRMPKELGGKDDGYTNPEQLFAAGYSACFDSALNLVALKSKVKLKNTRVTATVGIGDNGNGGFALSAKLEVSIPGLERDLAEKLMNQAHQVCPYSNATRNNMEVELVLIEE